MAIDRAVKYTVVVCTVSALVGRDTLADKGDVVRVETCPVVQARPKAVLDSAYDRSAFGASPWGQCLCVTGWVGVGWTHPMSAT